MKKNSSTLVIVSAPSGCGKDTLLNLVMERYDTVKRTVTATTRAPRPGEVDGVDYDFLTDAQFDALIEADGFWEWARYGGARYGTVKRNVEKLMDEGTPVIVLKIDVQGAQALRAQGYDVNTVFILPPSFAVLEHRLRSRATDGEEAVRKRLDAAVREMETAPEYDYLIVNDDLDIAVRDLVSAMGRGADAERFRKDNMLTIWKEVMKNAEV